MAKVDSLVEGQRAVAPFLVVAVLSLAVVAVAVACVPGVLVLGCSLDLSEGDQVEENKVQSQSIPADHM